jgi:hypothetical protein
MMRMSECHPARPHYAKGLCRNCYRKGDEVAKAYRRNDKRRDYDKTYCRTVEHRLAHIKWQYGLSKENFSKLVDQCNNICSLCGGYLGKFVIDHDHITGKIRGLLHRTCNSYLGAYEKGTQGIIDVRCEEYVRKHRGT